MRRRAAPGRGVGPGAGRRPSGRQRAVAGRRRAGYREGDDARRLCLLTVHAHPDDEASKGPGTVARYHAEGVRTVLVCCTGGEEGDILNPAMDTPEVRADLAGVRRRELEAAADAHRLRRGGHARLPGLGDARHAGQRRAPTASPGPRSTRRWAGSWPSSAGSGPRSSSPTATTRQGYPHPDHLRVHEISVAAFDAAGDPVGLSRGRRAVAAPLKLYYVGWSAARIVAMHEKFLELGLESPFDEAWLERASQTTRTYTTVDRHLGLRRRPARGPAGPRHPGRPDLAVLVRAPARGGPHRPSRRRVRPGPQPGGRRSGDGVVEDDLFAGVRDLAAR